MCMANSGHTHASHVEAFLKKQPAQPLQEAVVFALLDSIVNLSFWWFKQSRPVVHYRLSNPQKYNMFLQEKHFENLLQPGNPA